MMAPMSATPDAPSRAHRIRAMAGRDKHEGHRAATNLELLFDLTFVVAFSFAGNELAHAIAAGHALSGVLAFSFAMFAVVWAWINFSWFASAFDVDDWVYRAVTMVQMVGVLILALGIPPLFRSVEEGGHIANGVMVLGYVVMRVAMVFQWLRASRQAPTYASTCRTYAIAIAVAQLGWVALIVVPISVAGYVVVALILAALEMSGPVLAERRVPTPWHAHHIAERYGLLAIIALGEGIVGSTAALSAVIEADGWTWQTAAVGIAGVGLVFGLWWTYFTMPSAEVLHIYRNDRSFVWGYGHIALFGAIAAVGAGLHVAALQMEQTEGEGHHHLAATTAVLAVAVPVAVFTAMIFMLYTWLMGRFDRFHLVLLAGSAVVLVLSVVLAQAGVPMPVCLLVLSLVPLVSIVGYETVGHEHQSRALAQLS
ncbi:MAG: putative rane protein [Nocardioidaceae bacterium]|nr:putative rane protein [Nocardioidaceae bacterium]